MQDGALPQEPLTPGPSLLRRVRAGAVAQDTTLNHMARALGIDPSYARNCLLGVWDRAACARWRLALWELSKAELIPDLPVFTLAPAPRRLEGAPASDASSSDLDRELAA